MASAVAENNFNMSSELGKTRRETGADSGIDENTQCDRTGNHNVNAQSRIPRKTPPESPTKNRSRKSNKIETTISNFPRSKSVPKPFTSFTSASPIPESIKKVPMNKIVVGMSASPNLKQIRSKIGSLENATHKPGGGDIKIESRRLDWKTTSRTSNLNEGYAPKGGDKKIESRKLEWNAASKVGSMDNASHKPGGGNITIQSAKVEWKANSKVGSTDNIKHKPGGGNFKVVEQKLDLKVQSKVGSMANIKHKPGGGDKKVFNDVEYLRQTSSTVQSGNVSRTSSRRESTNQMSSLESYDYYPKLNNGKSVMQDSEKPTYQYQMKRRMLPFLPFVNNVRLRPRRHSFCQSRSPDFAACHEIKRRSLHGSFAGLHESSSNVQPLNAVLIDNGFYDSGKKPRALPPAPPASRNESCIQGGFGTTYSVITVN